MDRPEARPALTGLSQAFFFRKGTEPVSLIDYSYNDDAPEHLRRAGNARRESTPIKGRRAFAKRKAQPNVTGVHRRKNRRYHI